MHLNNRNLLLRKHHLHSERKVLTQKWKREDLYIYNEATLRKREEKTRQNNRNATLGSKKKKSLSSSCR